MISLAQQTVKSAHQRGIKIIVGDAFGIDQWVITACNELNMPADVYGSMAHKPRNGGTNHGRYIRTMLSYENRDRMMAERCDLALFIWNGKSRGTKTAYDYAISISKNARLITIQGGGHGSR